MGRWEGNRRISIRRIRYHPRYSLVDSDRQPDEGSENCLFDRHRRRSTPMAASRPDTRPQKAIPLHTVAGHTCAHMDSADGPSGYALYLFRAHPLPERPARPDERFQSATEKRQRYLPLPNAATGLILSHGTGCRRCAIPRPGRFMRCLCRTGFYGGSSLGTGRYARNDPQGGSALRRLSMGPLRCIGLAACLPVRWHGKSTPHFRHTDHHCRRPFPHLTRST